LINYQIGRIDHHSSIHPICSNQKKSKKLENDYHLVDLMGDIWDSNPDWVLEITEWQLEREDPKRCNIVNKSEQRDIFQVEFLNLPLS
jgi:hypothetical protein